MSTYVRGVGFGPDPRLLDRNDPKAMRDYRKRLREFNKKTRQFRRLPKEEQERIIKDKEGDRNKKDIRSDVQLDPKERERLRRKKLDGIGTRSGESPSDRSQDDSRGGRSGGPKDGRRPVRRRRPVAGDKPDRNRLNERRRARRIAMRRKRRELRRRRGMR